MDTIYLAAPPDSITEAAKAGCSLAYMSYRISSSGRLFRANMPSAAGGIMYIDDSGSVANNGYLANDIVRECFARRYSGVVLDLSMEFPNEIAVSIATACLKNKIKVFVPPHLSYCPDSIVLISTGISAGSLNAKLYSAIEQYGSERVAMEIDCHRADYTLPAKDGNGHELTESELNSMMGRYHSPSFFSKDLCTYYFTYRTANKAHLVLYDNAVSIRRKLALGTTLGISTAFLFYPHVKHVIARILEK